jgi:hypothetical protein
VWDNGYRCFVASQMPGSNMPFFQAHLSRQDFIRIPSAGSWGQQATGNQNRKQGRKQGLPRGSPPPASPAPRGAQRGLPGAPSRSRPTTNQTPPAESESPRATRNFRKCQSKQDSACSSSPNLGRHAWCMSYCRRVRDDLGYYTKCGPSLGSTACYLRAVARTSSSELLKSTASRARKVRRLRLRCQLWSERLIIWPWDDSTQAPSACCSIAALYHTSSKTAI